jgi:hypothetical protein
MTHKVELQGKCRRLFYAKVDFPMPVDENGDDVPGQRLTAGSVLGIASGGGALEELTGDELVIATYNDPTAPDRIGCVEEFYNPHPVKVPLRIDLAKAQGCCDAVTAHRTAKQEEDDFVFETSLTVLGYEVVGIENLRHQLKIQAVLARGTPRLDTITTAQTDLEACVKSCDDCCETVLTTRDGAVTFKADD